MCLYINNNGNDNCSNDSLFLSISDDSLWIQAINDIVIGLRSGYKKLQNRKVPFNMKGYNSLTI